MPYGDSHHSAAAGDRLRISMFFAGRLQRFAATAMPIPLFGTLAFILASCIVRR